jgi:carbonic anhydrase
MDAPCVPRYTAGTRSPKEKTLSKRFPIALMGMCSILLSGLTACGAPQEAPPEAAAPAEPAVAMPTAAEHAAAPAEHDAPHWTYEGEAGPDHWAALSEEFAACGSGAAQSPIDIGEPAAADLANIVFHYSPSAINVLNNGHTVQVNYDAGSYIELDGMRYDLAQFHFHAPSEHSVDGVLADAEIHLVHKSADDKLAVVGVLLNDGAANEAYQAVMDNLPATESPETKVEAMVDAAALLPAVQTTFRYAGSLTTPPCSEGVAWNVMTTPVELSAEQLAAYTAIFDGNNRPVQALGERALAEDSTP